MKENRPVGNICYVIRSLKAGGAEKYVLDLAVHFAKEMNTIYIVTLGTIDQKFINKYDLHYVRIIKLPVAGLFSLSTIDVVMKIHRLIITQNISLVHCNMLVPDILGGFAALLARCPYISTQHDTQPWRYHRTLRTFVYKYLHRFVIKFSRFMIAPSRSVKVYMHETERVVNSKIKVIYHGIDLEKFNMPVKKTSPCVKIGSVGRFSPEKGQLYTVNAFAHVLHEISSRTVKLLFAGDGPDLQMIINRSRELGIEQHVRFLGKIYDVPQFLIDIDILVHAAISSEAFCYAAVEGLAAGKAVIATSIDGIPEFLKDHDNGLLVQPESSEAISNALIEIIHDPRLYYRICRNAARSCRPLFSIDRMLRETENIYEKAIRGI